MLHSVLAAFQESVTNGKDREEVGVARERVSMTLHGEHQSAQDHEQLFCVFI